MTLSAIEQHQLWVREKLRPDFTLLEDCLDWSAVDSCLSATFNVVQIGQSALGAYRADDRAVAFVRACFVESEPGFRSRPSQDDRITILNVYSAVSIWRIRSGVPYSESVGFDRAARFLEGGARSGGARIDAIRNRLEMRILEIAETASARRSSLIELHLALATLRQLSDPSRPISARLREATASYLRRCIHRTGGIAAFRLAPDGQECLTACYSARRVAREILSLSEFEDPLERSMEFVRACWNPEAGGFATAPHAEPNLLHSHLGFHLMDPSLEGPNRTPPEFLGYREALSRFIDECRSGAGYAFAPDLPPSAFATRLAIQHRSRNPSARIEPEERARIVAQLGQLRAPDGGYPAFLPALEPKDAREASGPIGSSPESADPTLHMVSDLNLYESRLKAELGADDRYRDRFVAIFDGEVIDSDEDEIVLAERIWRERPGVHALIVRAGEDIPSGEVSSPEAIE